MDPHQYSDLHCHPAMKPFNQRKRTLWDTILGKKIRRIIRAQLKGKRGVLYDQCGYPKLTNAKVKLVFASLYPLEQGFMMNNNLILDSLNVPFKVGTWISMFFNRFRENIHLRDYLLSLFIHFKPNRIRELKGQEYWHTFHQEYRAYKSENNRLGEIKGDNLTEIASVIQRSPSSFPDNFKALETGSYTIADKNWSGSLPGGDSILTILTIEGIAIVTQTKSNAVNRRHGTKLLEESEIFRRLKYLKDRIPLFFITFSHHFSSGVCGHSRSTPDKARYLGLLNQEYFIHENFNDLGYRMLKYLLAVKPDGNGWVDDTEAGRRILIDVKHMSLRGRLTLYQLVSLYNRNKSPSEKIPVIASHVGYSNKSVAQQLVAIKRTGETTDAQIERYTSIYGREHRYNTWSINLAREEINWIIESDGLIGLSLEQNILGIEFGKKTKRKQPFFVHLVMNQLLDMASVSSPKFWDHITMGTDFDGIIDPVDTYSTSMFFHSLRKDLSVELNKISEEELQDAHLQKSEIKATLDKLFIRNALEFTQRHFDVTSMPAIEERA